MCKYFKGEQETRLVQESLDIEELTKLAKEVGICPYFHNKRDQEEADIILMPYNYLLDRQIRIKSKVKVSDAIIIIDEAHNISQAAEEAMSFQINTDQLEKIEYELCYLLSKLDKKLLKVEFEKIFPKYMNLCEGSYDNQSLKLKSNDNEIVAILKYVNAFKILLKEI